MINFKSAATAASAAILCACPVALAGSGAGQSFTLGEGNTVNKTTNLHSTAAFTGPQLQVDNKAGGGTALDLLVASGKPPMTVNSSARVTGLNADLLDGISSTGFWMLKGNGGTTPSTQFLGTTDNQPLYFRVNGRLALRLLPNSNGPNVIGGSGYNAVDPGVYAATVLGGANLAPAAGNHVTGIGGSVLGGEANVAGVLASVVGGTGSTATGNYSVAGGYGSHATADGAVALGYTNQANGIGSFATGGSAIAGGSSSVALGDNAQANHNESIVLNFSGGRVVTSNDVDTFTAATYNGARFISGFDPNTGDPNAGVSLAAGNSTWSQLSDRASKRNFTRVSPKRLLARLNRIPVMRWSYKAQRPSITHMGPTAQDFRRAFGLGEDSRHIDTIDSEGVALAAIQGLYRENQALKRRLARLERMVRAR